MSSYDQYTPYEEEDYGNNAMIPYEAEEYFAEAQLCEKRLDLVSNIVSDVSSSFSSIVDSFAQTSLIIKQTDAQLDALLMKLESNFQKFNAMLPMLERQLNRMSDKIDKIADQILTRNRGNLTKEEIQQQTQLFNLFQEYSSKYNDLLMRIMLY